jgi:ATP-dependent Clp protease protease subunit
MTQNCDQEAKMMMNPQFGEQIRRIIISGPIGDMTAASFLDQITFFEYQDVGVPINVYIDSPGGSVSSALAMLDAMTTCACPIRTIGMGQVASAAVLLLAAGDKNNRVISPNCRVMIHQCSCGIGGNTSEIENEILEVQRIQDIYNSLLSKYTGKKIAQIKADMVQNHYMGAKQAISYGICDRIMPIRKMGGSVIAGPKPKVFRVPKKKPEKTTKK